MTTPSALKPQARRPGPIGTGSAPPLTPDERHPPPRTFPGTRGATQGTRPQGFAPAFLEPDTGTIHLACYADGRPAPIHLLAGLPLERVASRDPIGTSTSVKPGLIAGFVRAGRFYTREQAVGNG